MAKKPITNKVIDIKSKKPFEHNKLCELCDDHQTEWVVKELCKVINKAEKQKGNAYNIAFAFTQVTVDYVHETAPDTLAAQHLLTTVIQKTLEDNLQKRLND